jgi:hypothetical protein
MNQEPSKESENCLIALQDKKRALLVANHAAARKHLLSLSFGLSIQTPSEVTQIRIVRDVITTS